jgi:hypothetical protein
MEPQPEPQLSRVEHNRITAIALQEAAIVLVENDSAFSVLLAECVIAGSRPSEFILENVALVRCRNKTWSNREFARVSMRPHQNGLWMAEDLQSGLFFREPSEMPYIGISIPKEEYAQLLEHVNEDRLLAVFAYSQKKFGPLPGFDAQGDGLMVPNEYAAAGRQVSDVEYVTEK